MPFTAALFSCDVPAVTETDTALQAAQLMKKAQSGCVVVLNGGKLAGIFSERDLLNRVLTEGKDPAKTHIIEVMTPGPLTVRADDPLERVFAIFGANRFRHVPVTDRGKVVGMASLTDLARVLGEVCKEPRLLQSFVDSIAARPLHAAG